MPKHQIRLFIIVLILFLCFPVYSQAVITLTFPVTESKFIPKYINGVNQNWFRAPRIQNAGVKYLLQDVNFNPIRFPGGTESNYYNWGVLAPDFTEATADATFRAIEKRFLPQVVSLSPIDSAKTINSFGKDISIVVNTMRDTQENIKNALQNLKNNNIDIKFIEMGNEGDFYPGIQPPGQYFRLSKKITADARAIYPNVKIGMVVSNLYWRTSDDPDATGSAKWIIPDEDWYDAVIVHGYVPSYNELLKNNQVLDFESTLSFGIRRKIDELVKKISGDYPGKKIWITEWNTAEKNEDRYLNGAYANSFHVYNMLLSMLQYPSIELANYHSIMGSTFGMINPKDVSRFFGVANIKFIPDEETFDSLFIKNIQYWPLKWIGNAVTNNTNFIIAPNTNSLDSPIGAIYFYNVNNAYKSFALINRTNLNQDLDISQLNRIIGRQVTVERLSGAWTATSTIENPISPTVNTIKLENTLQLKPFEIVYISTTESYLKSDLNKDGKVDITDYTDLVAHFGNPYTIFDFNLLIKNLNNL